MYIDLEMEIYLKKLEGKIRKHSFWGYKPTTPEWRVDQLGAYLDPINLPAFLAKLRVLKTDFALDYIERIGFKRRVTVFALEETKERFVAQIEKLIASKNEEEFSQSLLAILATQVAFVDEGIY